MDSDLTLSGRGCAVQERSGSGRARRQKKKRPGSLLPGLVSFSD